ncbi:hypothetical protein GCM10023212_28480 [Luteolibacter yonseiensis]
MAVSTNRTFVALGIVATALSLGVTAFAGLIDNKWVLAGLAFSSSLALGFITNFNLGGKAAEIRAAWRILETALLRYKNQEDFTMEKLLDAYKLAEDTLGNVNYTPPSKNGE